MENYVGSPSGNSLLNDNLNVDRVVGQFTDPFALEIPDEQLVKIHKERVKASQKFFDEKLRLKERRKKNEDALFGRYVDDKAKNENWKPYEARYSDNALYEIESSLKPLAMSHLPDIMVLPGSQDQDKQETAKQLSITLDDTNKKRKQRQVLGLGFKHLPVYLTAVVKTRWDPSIGLDGDYRFDIVHPEYIVVTKSATSTNPDDMDFISQRLPVTVQDVLMRFPNKKNDFYVELGKQKVIAEGTAAEWKDLATPIEIWETWFDWYKKAGSNEVVTDPTAMPMEPGVKWEKITGCFWSFGDLILYKSLDPNFDHKGEDKWFIQEDPSDPNTKRELTPQDMLQFVLSGQIPPNVQKETVYNNYFLKPHKPFFFFGYDQWGKTYLDETSRIEQNLRNQENLDIQGKQIVDTLRQRVKHIWSKLGGLKASDVQRMDMDDPKLDALVDDDVNKVHKSIEPERPDAAQFNSLEGTRTRMFSIAGASAIRGDLQSDVATTNQIGREADYSRADDIVEDTINAACEWMAEWQMQFIKLRYTEAHLRQTLGAKGSVVFTKLRRDMISDGMEVVIKSSSTDKLKAQRNAMDMAKLGAPYIDPLTFFEDMDMSDPEGRVEKGMTFMQDPSAYFAKYVLKLQDTNALAGALQQAPPPSGGQAPVPPQSDAQGQVAPNQPPATPSPQNTANTPVAQPVAPPQGSPRVIQ